MIEPTIALLSVFLVVRAWGLLKELVG